MACNRAGTVGLFKSLEVPALDDAGVTLTFAGARYVNLVAVCEHVSLDEVAYVVSAAIAESEFLQGLLRGNVALLEVAGERLAHALRLLIAEANLNCIVAVVFNSLLLCDNTRTGFNNCYGHDSALFVEICVMPIFLPMIAFCILYPPLGYWSDLSDMTLLPVG